MASFIPSDITVSELSSYLENTLGLKPDIDLHDISIKQIETDSLEKRARVLISLHGSNIKNNALLNVEKLVFLFKNNQDLWLFDIKSSLGF